jgi:hypothetical protein
VRVRGASGVVVCMPDAAKVKANLMLGWSRRQVQPQCARC